MVYRVFVEKKQGLAHEADALAEEIRSFLRVPALKGLRLINRYDVENISGELFEYCKDKVFSEPQLDNASDELKTEGAYAFAVEYLPGQFDQRADSAAQCIRFISHEAAPAVRTAKVYLLYGELTADEISRIKGHVINPVEAREASLERPETLASSCELPTTVETVFGFCSMSSDELAAMLAERGFAMDLDDLKFCQGYFKSEKRDPTITELKMIDTYWSDHCRHTTFNTVIDNVSFESGGVLHAAYSEYLASRLAIGRSAPVTLMDMGTLAAKYLKKTGGLDKLDASEEINACTIKTKVDVDGREQDWLLLFKNETHNHPTEIEPFGGAATCIGGAVRDPLSGRGYVYAAMRLTGAADPTRPIEETLKGKLPQRRIVTASAAGYSSYGNQLGLATGQVDEFYHPGYAAKHLELGAVIGAAPAENVRREHPDPGDIVILLGGRTGRDGCGGATGSSKSHSVSSLETCGAEVQKGNAPEERKLQRLFRDPEASRLIKRCNDFGAGGVSVAIGELADGLLINLDNVPKKYEGLDGTELAISESQERMAVVVAPEDVAHFMELADGENLEAAVVAEVREEPRLVMSWNGRNIVDISRKFLDSNGAEKHIGIHIAAPVSFEKERVGGFAEGYLQLAGDLNTCSRRGLSERFDSTIGAATVLMPFGGKNQLTPIQAMVHRFPVQNGHTESCSFMAWGYNPEISEKSPYHGAYLAVVESVSKLVAAGAEFSDVYLSFQEFFEKPGRDPERWGKPMAALLGAFSIQMGLKIAAIGGKDSMSGTFEHLDVPPTLVSFAVTTGKTSEVVSPEFKAAGHAVVLMKPCFDENGLPKAYTLIKLYKDVHELLSSGRAVAAYTPGRGGAAEAVMKMCFGNSLGFEYDKNVHMGDIFAYRYGAFVLELTGEPEPGMLVLGHTTENPVISRDGESVKLSELLDIYENRLESVYPCNIPQSGAVRELPAGNGRPAAPLVKCARPRVVIPVFPGTNCEYDAARAMEHAGAEAKIIVVNNLTPTGIAYSVERFAKELGKSQMLFIPGGFSGGDEPDGSGKFITAFLRNPAVAERVTGLLDERGGLVCGICNGFQALIKLGLVPYGRITDADEHSPTLTYNLISRHQSRLVRTRVVSNMSPWLAETKPGEVYSVPISHGEGRFLADEALIMKLAENGQIATQYVDASGNPTMDVRFNPNGSVLAVEGITSPDGRVFGRMGHSERNVAGLYKNVPGCFDMGIFRSAVKFFK